jgi:hypothetical protein
VTVGTLDVHVVCTHHNHSAARWDVSGRQYSGCVHSHTLFLESLVVWMCHARPWLSCDSASRWRWVCVGTCRARVDRQQVQLGEHKIQRSHLDRL